MPRLKKAKTINENTNKTKPTKQKRETKKIYTFAVKINDGSYDRSEFIILFD